MSDGEPKKPAKKPIKKSVLRAINVVSVLYLSSMAVGAFTTLMSGQFSKPAPDIASGHTYQIMLGSKGGPHYPGYVTQVYGRTMDISSDIFLGLTGIIICLVIGLAIAQWVRRRSHP